MKENAPCFILGNPWILKYFIILRFLKITQWMTPKQTANQPPICQVEYEYFQYECDLKLQCNVKVHKTINTKSAQFALFPF